MEPVLQLWNCHDPQPNYGGCYNLEIKLDYISPLYCFCGIKGHGALDRNTGSGYDTLHLRLISVYLLSACPHRQFHTSPGLSDSRAALLNFYPYACVPCREAVCTIFMMVFRVYSGARTYDLPCERRTC